MQFVTTDSCATNRAAEPGMVFQWFSTIVLQVRMAHLWTLRSTPVEIMALATGWESLLDSP